jgi:hypothetical protein
MPVYFGAGAGAGAGAGTGESPAAGTSYGGSVDPADVWADDQILALEHGSLLQCLTRFHPTSKRAVGRAAVLERLALLLVRVGRLCHDELDRIRQVFLQSDLLHPVFSAEVGVPPCTA